MSDVIRRASVVGVTSWGVTLSLLLARNGLKVQLVTRSGDETDRLSANVNQSRLAGITLHENVSVVAPSEKAFESELICFAVPSRSMMENLMRVRDDISDEPIVMSATKGFSSSGNMRMSELITDFLPNNEVAVLSGPNLSRELADGLAGATVIASALSARDRLINAFHSKLLRVYWEQDLIGVEYGGAMKNVIAIAAGMADSLDVGHNAKAALIVRGLAEISRLGEAYGADPLTFRGLSGAGDLIATAYSPLSRNRRFGEKVGSGLSTEAALEEIGETVEGLDALNSAQLLASEKHISMPICVELEAVLNQNKKPIEALHTLMDR